MDNALKSVDFAWLSTDATWLVEIKDPERTPEPQRAGEVRSVLASLRTGGLTDEHFLPKLFGTYVWLARRGLLRPIVHRYAVLIAMEELDVALRLAVGDGIQRAIEAVGPVDRSTDRAPVAEVHDLESWNGLMGAPRIVREA